MDNSVGVLSVTDEAVEQTASLPYTKLFESVFPYYLSIGMTYEQFWEQDIELVVYYRKAEELRKKRKNEELWLQGLYIYEALADTSPLFRDMVKGRVKAHPYCTHPKPITKLEIKEEQEREAREKRERLNKMMRAMAKRMTEAQKQE